MKFAVKFLCVKTSCGSVVTVSFIYLTVHRWIAGDVPIYLKYVLTVTHPFWKHRFGQISLNCTSAVRASEKSSVITNRKLTMSFLSSHRWILFFNPKSPKEWLRTRIFTFCVAFHVFAAGSRRLFRFGMQIDHSKSQPTDHKVSLKGARSRLVIHFKFHGPEHTSGIAEARIVKFLTQVGYI